MNKVIFIDRQTGRENEEKVYGRRALELLYGDSWISRLLGWMLLPLLVKWPFFSAFYGYLQKRPSSVKKIQPFIEAFKVDASEFLEPVKAHPSFNDFFIRRLKPTARPIASGEDVAVIPADGRYYFYQHLDRETGFVVKGQRFRLDELLEDQVLAERYTNGSMLIARLCPHDYHRFHFPCAGIPGETRLINGWLYSVNPMAIKRDIAIFTKNKRTVCPLQTKNFGEVLYLEIGATNVGSIHQTYIPFQEQAKGAEKGYFSFGASSLILLFEKGRIQFDADLLEASERGLEIRCLMGQHMGVAALPFKN